MSQRAVETEASGAGRDRAAAEWRLPCTLPQMVGDPVVRPGAAISVLGVLVTCGVLAMLWESGVRGLGFTGGAIALTAGTFVLGFVTWRENRGALTAFGDRLVVQRFRGGRPVASWEGEYRAIVLLGIHDRWVRFTTQDARSVRVRLDPLHVEDAVDFLVEAIEAANPGCDIVRGVGAVA